MQIRHPLFAASILAGAVVFLGCSEAEPLTPVEQAAKDRSECQIVAIDKSDFDPTTAIEPVRTVTETHEQDGRVLGSGALARGAAKGAVVGAAGGAIGGDVGKGAGVGAGAGAVVGGMRKRQELKEPVVETHANPEYQEFVAAKTAYQEAFESCLTERSMAREQ